jgi:hypothetical protein
MPDALIASRGFAQDGEQAGVGGERQDFYGLCAGELLRGVSDASILRRFKWQLGPSHARLRSSHWRIRADIRYGVSGSSSSVLRCVKAIL